MTLKNLKNLSQERKDIARITANVIDLKMQRELDRADEVCKEEFFNDLLAVGCIAAVVLIFFVINFFFFGSWDWRWLIPSL